MSTPESPSDPATQTARCAGGPFGYTVEGEGPTLLALHGLPGGARDFRWLASALAGRLRLVRLEQPGFGATPLSTAPGPTLEARTRFVESATEALELEDFVVLGHSMGGPLALSVAARLRRRTRGLALLASVGLRPHRLARKAPRRRLLTRALSLPGVPTLLGPVMREGFSRAGFPRSTPLEAMTQSMRIFSALSFEPIRRAARTLEAPTLVAWTDDDRLVESTVALELAGALPDGPRLCFAEGGHNLQKTQAVELADALVEFVTGLAGPLYP